LTGTKEITRIETQKRNKKRRSIFLDGEFAFGLDEELVYRYDLREGSTIDMSTLGRILEAEEFKNAKDRALRLLGYRARSEKELRDKLIQSGYDEDTIQRVIDEMKCLKFVNDDEFAAMFIRDRLRMRPCGSHLLKHELKQKGVSDEIIEKSLKEAYSEKSQIELALELANKKKKSYRNIDTHKERKRIADFLSRRGFDWEIITHVMERWQM